MYAWLFRHLPGPFWLKIIETLIILIGLIYVLFEHVYPWVHTQMNLDSL